MNQKKLEKLFGINLSDAGQVNKLDDLLNHPPFMVNIQTKTNCNMDIDGTIVSLSSSNPYIMPIDFYIKASRGENNNKILKPHRKKFVDIFKRYRGQNLDNKQLLIFRTGGLGDLMFSQPIVKYLKEKYPTCKIVYATAPKFTHIFNSWPTGLVDKVTTIPFHMNHMINSDYHLSFEGVIERCEEAKKENCYDLFSRFAGLNIDHRDEKYKIELIPNQVILNELKKEKNIPDNFVVVQMKASSPIRVMPSVHWSNIISELNKNNINVVYLDLPQRTPLYDQFVEHYNLDKSKNFNLCNLSKNINYAINILSISSGIVAIDSSMTHFGPALGIPTLGIYGSFRGDIRMKYYKNSDWVETINSDCPIMPCYFHSHQISKCPFLTKGLSPNCLEKVDTNLIVEKFLNLLKIEEKK
jgi:ADP-heptose:LPS heptosyltransferase